MRAWTADIGGRRPRLGYLLALAALCLQLVAPALPIPPISSAAQDEFVEFLRLHALCLGGEPAPQQPAAPGQDRSDRIGHHIGACCFLHGGASPFPAPAGTVRPIAFRISKISFAVQATTAVAARPVAAPRARAPPGEA